MGLEGGGGENVIRGYIAACERRVARCGRQAACALPQPHKETVEFAICYEKDWGGGVGDPAPGLLEGLEVENSCHIFQEKLEVSEGRGVLQRSRQKGQKREARNTRG